jgi:NFU1 iron-sulfur cluster scaffold homolog, mitochondrial
MVGFLQTIKSALGLQPPLAVTDGETDLQLSAAALERLQAVGADAGIHLALTPTDGGHVLAVTEGALQGPPPPGFHVNLTAADADLIHLRGLTLDRREDRWALSVELELRGRETPNPDGRLYLSNRIIAHGRPMHFTQGMTDLPPLAKRILAIPGVAGVLVRDNTITIRRADDSAWNTIDVAIDAAIRQHFLLCGRPLEAAQDTALDTPLAQEIWRILSERVLPGIHRDGGDLTLVSVDQGVVRVLMSGACQGCPASTATLRLGVERTLREALPGQITRVEQV